MANVSHGGSTVRSTKIFGIAGLLALVICGRLIVCRHDLNGAVKEAC